MKKIWIAACICLLALLALSCDISSSEPTYSVTIYTGTFDDSGNEIVEKLYGHEGTVTLPSYSRTNYFLLGFSDGSTLYQEGDALYVNADIVLTVLWEATEEEETATSVYTVTVTGLYSDKTTTADDEITTVEEGGVFVIPYYVRSGYTFKGLLYNGTTYAAGSQIVITEDCTLTAIWDLATIYSTTYTNN